jgi:hypothetical protein
MSDRTSIRKHCFSTAKIFCHRHKSTVQGQATASSHRSWSILSAFIIKSQLPRNHPVHPDTSILLYHLTFICMELLVLNRLSRVQNHKRPSLLVVFWSVGDFIFILKLLRHSQTSSRRVDINPRELVECK